MGKEQYKDTHCDDSSKDISDQVPELNPGVRDAIHFPDGRPTRCGYCHDDLPDSYRIIRGDPLHEGECEQAYRAQYLGEDVAPKPGRESDLSSGVRDITQEGYLPSRRSFSKLNVVITLLGALGLAVCSAMALKALNEDNKSTKKAPHVIEQPLPSKRTTLHQLNNHQLDVRVYQGDDLRSSHIYTFDHSNDLKSNSLLMYQFFEHCKEQRASNEEIADTLEEIAGEDMFVTDEELESRF